MAVLLSFLFLFVLVLDLASYRESDTDEEWTACSAWSVGPWRFS